MAVSSNQCFETRMVDWADIRSRPTEAVPRHTLFGTSLELLNDEDKKDADRLFVKNQIEQKNAKSSMHSFKYIGAEGDDILKKCKDELEEQKNKMKIAQEQLKQKELDAKYVAVKNAAIERNLRKQSSNGPVVAPYATIDSRISTTQSRPSDNTKRIPAPLVAPYAVCEVNTLQPEATTCHPISAPQGLRSRYQSIPLPPQSATTAQHVTSAPPDNQQALNRRRAVGLHYVPKEYFMEEMRNRKVDVPPLPIEIPRNILHQFRTDVCVDLLSDADKVRSSQWALNKEARRHLLPRREVATASYYEPVLREPTPAKDNNDIDMRGYEALGHAVRTNVFPGTAGTVKMGTTHRDYNSAIWRDRYPVTDKYRNRVDELAKWSESNVYRGRIMKAWDQYDLERKENKRQAAEMQG